MSATAVPINFPSMTPRMVSTVKILSISPFHLIKQMALGHCLYNFEIPPQPRGKYHILEVSDTYTLIRTGFQNLSDTNPDAPLGAAPIHAEVLGKSLVAEWSRKLARQGETGVRLMPAGMVEGSPEFHAFLADMTGGVRAMAEWAIREANDMVANSQGRFISDQFHRTLAKWLMGDDGARAISWYNAQSIDALKKCIACGDSISALAFVCKSCGKDLIEYFIKYDMTAADDPIVAARVTKITMPKPTEGTHSTAGEPLTVNVAIPADKLPNDARVSCVASMTGEQKGVMNTKKGQAERDEYIVSIIPELCLRNTGLRDVLKAKGYVIVNEV